MRLSIRHSAFSIQHSAFTIHHSPFTILKRKPPAGLNPSGVLKKLTGSALLSRALKRSIIAAGALNGRVRDGNGCDSPAIATSQKGRQARTTGKKRKVFGESGETGPGQRVSPPACRQSCSFRAYALSPRVGPVKGGPGGMAVKPHGQSEPVR